MATATATRVEDGHAARREDQQRAAGKTEGRAGGSRVHTIVGAEG